MELRLRLASIFRALVTTLGREDLAWISSHAATMVAIDTHSPG